ncbi:MAG: 50S ribosomal protein L5, partial [Desulfurococcaceae archaeon]
MTIFDYVKNVDEILKNWEENPMLLPRIAKVTVNVGVGALTERIPRIAKVLEEITGQKPVPRKA